ncbi:hypothetical protein [Reyranella sp.]|nr:hypothetical protein [Reyranella sp.]
MVAFCGRYPARATPVARAGHTLSQQIQSRGAHCEAVGHVLLGGKPAVFL